MDGYREELKSSVSIDSSSRESRVRRNRASCRFGLIPLRDLKSATNMKRKSEESGTRTKTVVPSYASRLSECPNKGVVGLSEIRDNERTKKSKLTKLAKFCKDADNIVVLTGAGISTSAGISDFRGPNGVWTKEEQEKKAKKKQKRSTPSPSSSTLAVPASGAEDHSAFERAIPTLTHTILRDLHAGGKIHFVISQNVDGLHLRSSFPRENLVELHGNVFIERCIDCKHEVFHDSDVGGIGCKATGNTCEQCGGAMYDTVLDWDTPICEEEMALAEQKVSEADLVLCLGTSLRIIPAAELPLLVGTGRKDNADEKFCIVNLQKTPLDDKAALVIRCEVDEVMQFLGQSLLPLPATKNEDS